MIYKMILFKIYLYNRMELFKIKVKMILVLDKIIKNLI